MSYYNFRQPVTRRAGNRARVTVETGAPGTAYNQDLEVVVPVGRDNRTAEPELIQARRPERWNRRLRDSIPRGRQRRDSWPSKTTYDSPRVRPGVPPPPEPADDTEYVIEPIAAPETGDAESIDFKIPAAAPTLRYSEDIAFVLPNADPNSSQDKPAPISRPKFTGQMNELLIQQSQWVGNTFERGVLTAELKTLPTNVEKSEKETSPLMRWYHLHRPMMNFEEFIAASQSVLQVSDKQQRDVVKLLRDVQKKFEKQRHHGRDMEPDCVSDIFYNDSPGGSNQTESVLFLSFPYFSLETYNSATIKALSPGSPMHPGRPMLQANFYSSTQKRELAQAITTIPTTPNGECLHISQLWCLVVDGNTMITCSRMPVEALCREAIVREAIKATADDQIRIKVSINKDRSWMVPIHADTSWPSFLAMFGEKVAGMETQGASVQFTYEGRTVDGKSWPGLVEAARKSLVELTMQDVRFHTQEREELIRETPVELDDGEERTTPPDEVEVVEPGGTKQGREIPVLPQTIKPQPSGAAQSHDALQMFSNTDSPSDERHLANTLHEILISNERKTENEAYRQCPRANATDVDAALASMLQQMPSSPLLKSKRMIVLMAKYLYSLFWSGDIDSPIVEKFWGALSEIISRRDEFFLEGHNDPKADISAAAKMCRVLYHDILPLASSLTSEFIDYKRDLQPLPDAFSKAWLHLVMAMVLTAGKPLSETLSFQGSAISKHLRAIPEELEKGKLEIMTRLKSSSPDLDELEICTENSILSLLMNKLAQDLMHGCPDVDASYTEYLQSLEFNITQDPAPRYHQETIRFFLQEIEAILATLKDQLSVVEVFQQSLEQQAGNNDAVLLYSLGQSRQSVVIEDCKARLGGRISKFKGLQRRAEDLGEWHRNEMDTHKDRQENAIMVFTIVTIIFLPLSFVSSVFGMNTKDVRDMPYNQWAYWAAGIPLTLLVVLGSLWWAGELWTIRRWFGRATSRSKSPSVYRGVQEPGLVEMARTARPEADNERNGEQGQERKDSRSKRRTTYPRGDV